MFPSYAAPAGGTSLEMTMSRTCALIVMTAASLSIGAAPVDSATPGVAKLVRALDGRTAGKAANCVSMRYVRSSRIIDHTAIIFEIGDTLYVNQPISGAELLSDSKALLTRTISTQLCKGEAVELIDTSSWIQAGAIFIGEFVPYRKRSQGSSRPNERGYSAPGY